MRRTLTGLMLLAFLAFGAATAHAEPVQEFAVQLKNPTPDGRYTVIFSSNSYDTTGDPPPSLAANSVRLPKGVAIKPAFLRKDVLCEPQKLKELLIESQNPTRSYIQMLENLPRAQKQIRAGLTPAQRRVLDVCVRAHTGRGSVIVDARPFLPDPIPAFFHIFLSRPAKPGAIASFGVLSFLDQSVPIAKNNPLIGGQKFVFQVNLFNDPTPDGLYGYRLLLPPGNVGGIPISIAELRVENPGISRVTEKKTCLRKQGSRCVKTKVTKTSDFWAEPPDCPASGQLQFQADYTYVTGLSTSKVIQVPCPRFTR